MTIICAEKQPDGSVWIGSDTRMVTNDFIMPLVAKKWIELDGWHIGIAGWARAVQLLERDVPPCSSWGAAAMAEHIRKMIKDDDWLPHQQADGGDPRSYSCHAILVSPAREVFELLSSGALCPLGNEFSAMGSGADHALGAAFALPGAGPETRIRTAIAAACKYQSSCGGDIFIKKIEPANTAFMDCSFEGSTSPMVPRFDLVEHKRHPQPFHAGGPR